jgi:methyltransferase (TIGR00027 family)
MVIARSRHIDTLLSNSLDRAVKQLVLVGAGLDFRALRVPHDSGLRVFELDLPDMLVERAKVSSSFHPPHTVQSQAVALNLEFDDIATALRGAGFDPASPSLFVFEGMSMYFEEPINRTVLSSIRSLMEHPESRLWCDVVAGSVVRNTSGYAQVEAFIAGMAKLGEPFIFGLDRPVPFFESLGYEVASDERSSSDQLGGANPIYDLYRFYVLRAVR